MQYGKNREGSLHVMSEEIRTIVIAVAELIISAWAGG